MEAKEKKIKKKKKKEKQSSCSSDISFKPSSDVKGLKFGGQIIIKSFTIRRARTIELLKLLSLPQSPLLPSTTAYLPTNFTILAHHAWHTLTLGLGTKKSKVVVFVFESEAMKMAAMAAEGGMWPPEIPLGDVNKKMIRRGMKDWEMARFKFRKGCITFYVYAVRKAGNEGFAAAEDLKVILQAVVALKDFMDHTAMLVMPHQKSIHFTSSSSSCSSSAFAMAH